MRLALNRASAAALGAIALLGPISVSAADDFQSLRSEIEALKKELRELKEAQSSAQRAAPARWRRHPHPGA